MENLSKILPPEMMPILKEVIEAEIPKEFMKPDAGTAFDMMVQVHKGHRATVDHINTNWQFNDNEVLVASYPKTGTNWTIEVVNRLIFQDTDQFNKWKLLPMPISMLELGIPKKTQIFDKLPFQRRVFGTHFYASGLNMEMMKKKKMKIVYVLRNPKDMLVSMFNFFKKLPPFQFEPMKSLISNGFKHFYDEYMDGKVPMDGYVDKMYLDHIIEWLKVKEDMGVYFLYYENLKKDFQSEVRKLAKYLEVPLSDEKLLEITNECTINSMKKNYEARSGFQSKFATAFINKGGVGGWKDYFTVRQSEEWDKLVEEKLKGTEVSFKYTI